MATGKGRAAAKTAPLADYIEKPLSETHKRAVQWIEEQTGAKIDPETLKLTVLLYQRFQRSDFNKAGNEAERAANAQAREARAKAAEERKAASAAKKDELAAKRAERAAAKKSAAKAPAKKAAPAKAAAKKAPAKAAGKKEPNDTLPRAPKPRPRKRVAGSTAPF